MGSEPRRVRLDLAYDGTDFAGWQVQPEARTVQGLLEEKLTRVQGADAVRVRGAARTDAGVHSRGQVADAEVRTRLNDGDLEQALSSMLPQEVRVLGVRTVATEFHSRYRALSKTYRYLLDRTPQGNPFLARYALHHPRGMDEGRLLQALQSLPGRRDWSGFAGAACDVEDRVRHLMEASYVELGTGLGVFTFEADGFLNHMVRNLVGTLLEVARGRFAPERIHEILDSRDRRLAGPTAPARGLILDRVTYDSDEAGAPLAEEGPVGWTGLVT